MNKPLCQPTTRAIFQCLHRLVESSGQNALKHMLVCTYLQGLAKTFNYYFKLHLPGHWW